MRLQTKIVLLITSLLVLIILFLGIWVEYILSSTLKEQIGTRALVVAETVSEIPDIQKAFLSPQPSVIIQPIAERIRKKSGAEYVVIGNLKGIRYSHPEPDRIGKEMEGGDNRLVLQGKSIVSEAVGSLGPSLRGKAPIFDANHHIIGIVSVGFLLRDIDKTIEIYRNKVLMLAVAALILGLLGAVLITRNVKSAILGLEPEEISLLYQEKNAILESVREGIVAINAKGFVTMMNHSALKLLNLSGNSGQENNHITQLIPESRLTDVLANGEADFDQETVVGENVLIVNRLPIVNQQHQVIGAVASFRNKTELSKLIEELSEVKRYAEVLRAQTHEYSNKLHMILGLIQLESYSEAIELISREVNFHQNLLRFIMDEIPDPMIGGILIGKFNRANELKIQLEINRESSFRDVPESIDRNHISTILGNLIDNAMDAVLVTRKESKKVNVFLTDIGKDLIIEVEDNGPGILQDVSARMFEINFSTKEAKGHGYGLALVNHSVNALGGYTSFDSKLGEGTIFTVVLPKPDRKE